HMWFEDLTEYNYLRLATNSSVRTLNVGWLEESHAFSSGPLPLAAVERLRQLVEFGPTNATRGLHFCRLCPAGDDDADRACGHAEIRVVGTDGTRYAAPTLIHHYVTVHNYKPPQAFVDALTRANLQWATAREGDLCLSCGASLRRTGIDRGLV